MGREPEGGEVDSDGVRTGDMADILNRGDG
jgi:hypothetical protein